MEVRNHSKVPHATASLLSDVASNNVDRIVGGGTAPTDECVGASLLLFLLSLLARYFFIPRRCLERVWRGVRGRYGMDEVGVTVLALLLSVLLRGMLKMTNSITKRLTTLVEVVVLEGASLGLSVADDGGVEDEEELNRPNRLTT